MLTTSIIKKNIPKKETLIIRFKFQGEVSRRKTIMHLKNNGYKKKFDLQNYLTIT